MASTRFYTAYRDYNSTAHKQTILQQHNAFLCSDQTPDGLLQAGGREGRRSLKKGQQLQFQCEMTEGQYVTVGTELKGFEPNLFSNVFYFPQSILH